MKSNPTSIYDLPLAHYSAQPITEPIRFTPQEPGLSFKPRGLWISVEDGFGWRDWCESEEWGLDRCKARHIVRLASDANILWLRTVKDIDRLTKQYRSPDDFLSGRRYRLRWFSVAQSYQGIIIAPYCWARRLHDKTSWYYSWDCSSGCIWNPSAIASVRLDTRFRLEDAA